jgi:hypothetical protein
MAEYGLFATVVQDLILLYKFQSTRREQPNFFYRKYMKVTLLILIVHWIFLFVTHANIYYIPFGCSISLSILHCCELKPTQKFWYFVSCLK